MKNTLLLFLILFICNISYSEKIIGPTDIVNINPTTIPASGNTGEIRYNTSTNQLNYFNGTSWVAIGSASSNVQTPDGANNYNITSARITGSTCTIQTSDPLGADWLDSCTRNSAGDYDLTVTTGIFTAAPTCQVTTNGGTTVASIDSLSTTTNIGVLVRLNSTNAFTDTNWEIICIGER